MANITSSRFFELPSQKPDLPENQHGLHRLLQASLVYIPVLLGFNALGFTVIYVLGFTGLLDKNEPRLLIIAGISLLTSILHIPLFALLRRAQLNLLSIFILLINSLGSASQVFLWQGIVWFPLLLAISPALIFIIQNGLQQRVAAEDIDGLALFMGF